MGGVLPESMIGASEAQREAQRRTGLRSGAASASPEDRKDADEYINRTVELVSRIVGEKEYASMVLLRQDIEKALDRFESIGRATD